jgi:SNF2 family DNA or RNA helicase
VFEDEISKPWQRGEEHGFLRLKALVRAITIGRTKKVVELPVRIDEIHHLDFSPAERKRYETAEKDTVSLLEAISSGHQGGTFNACFAVTGFLRNQTRLGKQHYPLMRIRSTGSSLESKNYPLGTMT